MTDLIAAYSDSARAESTIREFVEQEQMLGIAHAVGCLERRISSPFLLFLGDIAFQAPNLGKMIEIQRTHGATVLGAMEDQDPASIRKNFSILHEAISFFAFTERHHPIDHGF